MFGNSSTRMAAAVAGRGAVGAGGMFSTAGGSSRGVAPGADAAAWSTGVGADHATGAAGRDDGLPAAGPWDKLSITRKLLSCISAELSSCELLFRVCVANARTRACTPTSCPVNRISASLTSPCCVVPPCVSCTGCCMIADVLDLSCALEGCLVQPGVCEPLDELRQTLDQLPTLLTQVCWSTRVGLHGFVFCRDVFGCSCVFLWKRGRNYVVVVRNCVRTRACQCVSRKPAALAPLRIRLPSTTPCNALRTSFPCASALCCCVSLR